MKSDGLSPDVYSYAGCIDACAKAAQWKKACQILGQMREAGVEVGSVWRPLFFVYIPYIGQAHDLFQLLAPCMAACDVLRRITPRSSSFRAEFLALLPGH